MTTKKISPLPARSKFGQVCHILSWVYIYVAIPICVVIATKDALAPLSLLQTRVLYTTIGVVLTAVFQYGLYRYGRWSWNRFRTKTDDS